VAFLGPNQKLRPIALDGHYINVISEVTSFSSKGIDFFINSGFLKRGLELL
jgi:hypothetical protein